MTELVKTDHVHIPTHLRSAPEAQLAGQIRHGSLVIRGRKHSYKMRPAREVDVRYAVRPRSESAPILRVQYRQDRLEAKSWASLSS